MKDLVTLNTVNINLYRIRRRVILSSLILPTQQSPQKTAELKWNSHQKAIEALFVIEYELNLHVKA